MSQEQVTICKFDQSGFCKFKHLCKKEHVNEICENHSECKNEVCTKRHPKICRHFNKNGSCRHSDQCAYVHTVKQSDAQQKLYEILATALATQIKETADKRNEVIELKLKVQHLENYIQTNKVSPEEKEALEGFEKDLKTTENIFEHDELDQNDTSEVEELYDCSECNYSCKKNITLMKHMNTKHVVKDDDTCSTRSKASINSSKKKNSSEQLIKTSKFFCDECDYGCMSKKIF